MNQIIILLEIQGSRRDPEFTVKINGHTVNGHVVCLEKIKHLSRIMYEIDPIELKEQNQLSIEMNDKNDEDNICPSTGEFVDHHISIKQIRIDNVDADALLFKKSYFRHSMSKEWIEQMKVQGHDILDCYQPGTDMHINGIMTFEFNMPFWLDKVFFIDQAHKSGE